MSFRYSSPANPISNSIQLRNPRDPHIDMRNLVPGSKVYHACLWQPENPNTDWNARTDASVPGP